MRTLIISVGTSLLTNRTQQAVPSWQPWRQGEPLPSQHLALSYLAQAEAVEASAETNTLAQLEVGGDDRLVWLHSDTPEGRWCAQVLHRHLAATVRESTLAQATGLGYGERSFEERGLRNLVTAAVEAIRDGHEAGSVAICATGGFKAEIAYLNLVGTLLGVPVHYIHERFRTLITLPPLPIGWDHSLVERHRTFFDWIDGEPRRTAEVESWLKAAPDLRQLVSEADDGHSFLTPAGTLLYGAFKAIGSDGPRAVWPAACTDAPAAKDLVSTEPHHRPPGWERWVERLTGIDCVCTVRYDRNGHGTTGRFSRIYLEDPATGALGIIFGSAGNALPLLVETTARGAAQLALVRGYLEREMRKW